MLEGFDFGTPAIASQLTGNLAALKKYNGLEIPKARFFSSEMERLRNRFLNVRVDAVLHPASESAQQVAKEQKDKAERQVQELGRSNSNATLGEIKWVTPEQLAALDKTLGEIKWATPEQLTALDKTLTPEQLAALDKSLAVLDKAFGEIKWATPEQLTALDKRTLLEISASLRDLKKKKTPR